MVDVQCPNCKEFLANPNDGALNFTLINHGEYVTGSIHKCYGCEAEIKLPALKTVKVMI
jgi:hypothetical protein